MAKNQNDRAVIDLVINGQQSQASLKQISLEATRARSALLKMKEADDPAAYQQKLKEYQALANAQREMTTRINGTSSAWSRFKSNMASTALGLVGGNVIGAAFSAIGAGVSKAINSYREFNAASQELSAVTGATGADLDYLNQTAMKLGPSFGKSGAEMLEAYKLMASAKPELLANKELLVETTKAAITLSQAGKIDLAEATQVTAESLNQFGESADQANRYINVIAAGAKEGSAEIRDMGVALKNSGTVAAAQGVSFEQTNGILQSMSTIALKGGEAGTQLRNVLLTLGSGANETNPRVVGLDKALENLAKQNLSTAEMTKLFGKENITAAQHIITHRQEISELTKRITGTQEAFTQAEKNNASFDHQLQVFWARVEGLAVLLGSKLVPALSKIVSGANALVEVFTDALTPASQKATQAFSDQKAKVDELSKNLSPLLDRYDVLSKKTALTRDEQAELKTIVGQVASVVPSAVTEFDKYGNALGINTQKARDFIKVQQEMLKYTNRTAIEETDKDLTERNRQRAEKVAKLNAGTTTEVDHSTFGGSYRTRQMTEQERRQLQAEVTQLNQDIADLEARKAGLTGSYLNGQSATTSGGTGGSGKPAGGGSGKASGPTDEEKKKAEAKKTANAEANLAIEKMNVEAIHDEQQRELAQAQWQADQEKERVRTSIADESLKAAQLKAIEARLAADKRAINAKYDDQKREQLEQEQKDIFEAGEKELAFKKRMAEYEIDLAVSSGKMTKEQGEQAKLNAENAYLTGRRMLVEAYYRKLAEQNQQSDKNTEKQNQEAAKRLKQIELDKQTALLEIQTQGAQNSAKYAELNQEKVEKALQDDLKDAEIKRQKALNDIQKKSQSGELTPQAAQNAELEVERQFLAAKRKLHEDYYAILARMGNLSAEQLKEIERAKSKDLTDIDAEMLKAQQAQYEGMLGGIKKYMDNIDQYVQQGADALKTLFEPNQKTLDVGPLLTELDKLQHKTNLTSSEQERMKDIIAQIGTAMPSVVTGTNEYGEAISINTQAATQEVEAQKKRAKVMHAIMVAQAAWSAAMATVEYGQAVMRIWATSVSPIASIGQTALLTAQYVATLAKIKSQTFSAPQFADGGFTGLGDGPAGFVSSPTMFSMGQRRYIAGEAGREFIISNKSLQNPVVANFARIMDAAQKTGNYSQLGAGSSPANLSGSAFGSDTRQSVSRSDQLLMQLINEHQMTRAALETKTKQQVILNYRVFEQYESNLSEARIDNTL